MPVDLTKRIVALFRSDDESSLELVMTANGIAALGLALLAWLRFELPLSWAAAVVPVTFVLLTACLLFRQTLWIAAALGSIVIAVSAAFMLAGLMSGIPYGTWLGGGLGSLGGLAVAGWTYARVGRIARSLA
jgi:hypothetical protein